jgi:ATP-dependent DNA helicase RecG
LFEASPSEVSVTFFIDSNQFAEKFVDGFAEKFIENEVQRTIIKLMREQPAISAKAIAENVGMSSRGVQKNIDALKKAGLVERVGAAKGGHWAVKLEKANGNSKA